jgi:hypothetical protein
VSVGLKKHRDTIISLCVPIPLSGDNSNGTKRRSWRVHWPSKNKSDGIFPAHSFLVDPPHQTVQAVTLILDLRSFFLFVSLGSSGKFTPKGKNQHSKTSYQRTSSGFLLAQRLYDSLVDFPSESAAKSMLPKLRPSSRIGARRATSGDIASRIARCSIHTA